MTVIAFSYMRKKSNPSQLFESGKKGGCHPKPHIMWQKKLGLVQLFLQHNVTIIWPNVTLLKYMQEHIPGGLLT